MRSGYGHGENIGLSRARYQQRLEDGAVDRHQDPAGPIVPSRFADGDARAECQVGRGIVKRAPKLFVPA